MAGPSSENMATTGFLAGGLVCFLLIPCVTASMVSGAKQPNILYILVDDWGWADAGWHTTKRHDLQSPKMNELAKEGVELDRLYVYMFCSPTRAAVQSGRNPIHVNVLNGGDHNYNPKDRVSGFAGIPRNMTGMAEIMKRAGYETSMYGKWDAGFATPDHTPQGRGYEQSLNYFHHQNDYWTMTKLGKKDQCKNVPIVDLWHNNGPAHGRNNSFSCSQTNQKGCLYEDQLFADNVMKTISNRQTSKPFFIFWAPHTIHEADAGYQVPDKSLDRFPFIQEVNRSFYHAMVNFLDDAVGNVTDKLKAEGLWDNTLIIVHSDNGGPIGPNAGANNYPLKGGKKTNWEGGVRANAFVSGGLLPKAVRGTKNTGLMAGWDWYATVAALAGEDPTDHKAKKAGLPAIDSYNLWPLISGQTKTSPRKELALGAPGNNDKTAVGGLISAASDGWYKVVLGTYKYSGWTGPTYPNMTFKGNMGQITETCKDSVKKGCLYNIRDDPSEHVNLAQQKPAIFNKMIARVAEIQKTAFSPDRGSYSKNACNFALNKYGGFWGPFIDVDKESSEQELLVV